MAWHHDGGVLDVNPSPDALLDEKERLVRSIVAFHPSGGGGGNHATTVDALRAFLLSFRHEEIPCVRLYDVCPAWQQQSRLLTQQWDKHDALPGARVIWTLITPQGTSIISRKALGGGTWTSKTTCKLGKDIILTKLYFKKGASWDGVTAIEFRLTTTELHLPHVAICVLHRTDYHNCVPDLRRYILQGCFPGRNQANLQVVPNVPPICQANNVAGLMNGTQADYNTDPVSNSESSGYSRPMNGGMHDMSWDTNTSYSKPSIHSSLEAPPPPTSFDVLSQHQFSENNSMPEPLISAPPIVSMEKDYGYLMRSDRRSMFEDFATTSVDPNSSGYNPPAKIMRNIPSNNWHMDGDMHDMLLDTNLAGQHSTQNYDYNNSIVDANPLIHDALSSGYDPLAGMQMNIPSIAYPMNDNMHHMPCGTNMLSGQHSHVDEMSTHNYGYNNSTGNINSYADPPIQDAMLHFDQTCVYGELPDLFWAGKII